ncbi:hypothetical protein K1719_006602 [Acacia pycnantha]|nr:hypothetical protein K1719_006602 [Acacia pycnantha]
MTISGIETSNRIVKSNFIQKNQDQNQRNLRATKSNHREVLSLKFAGKPLNHQRDLDPSSESEEVEVELSSSSEDYEGEGGGAYDLDDEDEFFFSDLSFPDAGSGMDGMLSAVHGFNTGIPYLQNRLKGPKWLPFQVGLPPLLIYSGASAAFGGYVLPKFAQLTVTSYYAASSASQ